jgi:hypothetical protein
MFSGSSIYGAEGIAIGDNWWLPGPYVTMNMYGSASGDINWLWVGGHLNMYGGTMNIKKGVNMSVNVNDALTRVDIYAGKLIMPADVNDSAIKNWISRGILLAYGRTPGTEGCDVIIDTKTTPGRIILTATAGSSAMAEAYCNEKPNEADLWAKMEQAVWSIEFGKDSDVESIKNNLLTNFKSNPRLPEVLFYIAGMYESSDKFDKANEIYSTIIQNWPEVRWGKNSEFELAKINVLMPLDKCDEPNTLLAIDQMIAVFSERPDLPSAIYDFASRVDRQNKGVPSNLSKEIYNRIAGSFPISVQAQLADLNERKMEIFDLIDSSDDANAIAFLDRLIIDFRESKALPEAIYYIGEKYWKKAVEAKKNHSDNESKEAFKKAAN